MRFREPLTRRAVGDEVTEELAVRTSKGRVESVGPVQRDRIRQGVTGVDLDLSDVDA
jgi:hypothetical protein